jgi:hypothetical protein
LREVAHDTPGPLPIVGGCDDGGGTLQAIKESGEAAIGFRHDGERLPVGRWISNIVEALNHERDGQRRSETARV